MPSFSNSQREDLEDADFTSEQIAWFESRGFDDMDELYDDIMYEISNDKSPEEIYNDYVSANRSSSTSTIPLSSSSSSTSTMPLPSSSASLSMSNRSNPPGVWPTNFNDTILNLEEYEMAKWPDSWDNYPELQKLKLNYNILDTFPTTWPSKLIFLELENNFLSKWPNTWPPHLQILNVSGNRFTTSPTVWPDELIYINLSENPLQTIPSLPDRYVTIEMDETSIQTLDNNSISMLFDYLVLHKRFNDKKTLNLLESYGEPTVYNVHNPVGNVSSISAFGLNHLKYRIALSLSKNPDLIHIVNVNGKEVYFVLKVTKYDEMLAKGRKTRKPRKSNKRKGKGRKLTKRKNGQRKTRRK